MFHAFFSCASRWVPSVLCFPYPVAGCAGTSCPSWRGGSIVTSYCTPLANPHLPRFLVSTVHAIFLISSSDGNLESVNNVQVSTGKVTRLLGLTALQITVSCKSRPRTFWALAHILQIEFLPFGVPM